MYKHKDKTNNQAITHNLTNGQLDSPNDVYLRNNSITLENLVKQKKLGATANHTTSNFKR